MVGDILLSQHVEADYALRFLEHPRGREVLDLNRRVVAVVMFFENP